MNKQSFGTLFVVATPIGNLGDMTPRAIDCLKQADVIACEDTRTSAKLLRYFDINTKTYAYHDHNADKKTERLIELLKQGKNIALISDAGTPLISDPGFRLTQACHRFGIQVSPVVGACAAIGALSVAGLPSDKFYFYGFLPAKSSARQHELNRLKSIACTLIFYEAPHRIIACLTDMMTVFGAERQVALCRELTKTFETIRLDTLLNLGEFVKNDPNQQKGEMVLVVSGEVIDDDDVTKHDTLLLRLLADLPLKKAVALASDITSAKKNALYERALALKNHNDMPD